MARKKIRPEEVTFSRYDTADYLKSEEDIAAYLEAVMEDDDPKLLALALGNIARVRGMMQLSRETGLTREGLYKALSAEGNPSFDTVLRVMKALGLRLKPHVESTKAERRRKAG